MTREEAAKILSEIWYLTEKDAEAVDVAIKALNRPTGQWDWDDEGYYCSECRRHVYGCIGEVLDESYKWCPYCGADMNSRYAEQSEG